MSYIQDKLISNEKIISRRLLNSNNKRYLIQAWELSKNRELDGQSLTDLHVKQMGYQTRVDHQVGNAKEKL